MNKKITSKPPSNRSKKTASARRKSAKKLARKASGKEVSYEDVSLERRDGGDSHQTISEGMSTLTTQQGVPVADNQNTLTVGERGPQLLEDFVMREKIFHFDHERIPERVVHARGYGARGYFETYDSLSDVTQASLFQQAGSKTDVFVRFSTVAGSAGSADLARDARGFAVKFYSETGNWDLVGNNIPVFFIQDAMKFPDLVHSVKPEPHTGFPQAQSAHDNFWDFVSLVPESTHMLMWTMSDRGIPRSFRFMEGFGVHTFRFVNAQGESTYVKFHWKPKLGLQSVVWNEALKINGADPDFHRRDLYNAIDAGDYPEWELGVQLFDDAFADEFEFDILDPTKLIPEEQIPVRPIGRMVLNRNVDNVFAEIEQVAFCTSNVVPGIDFTNDPLLQGRNFSYLDTQLKRLGSPNFAHLPVNAPRCPFAHFQQDGHMSTVQPKGRANYEPNSWAEHGGPRENAQTGYQSFAASESGEKRRVRPTSFSDHYSQARQFYLSQNQIEQAHIADAFAFELSKVKTPAIRKRVVSHLLNVDEQLGQSVASRIGIQSLPKPAPVANKVMTLDTSPALSILANGPDSFKGRTVGVLVDEGTDAKTLSALRAVVKKVKSQLKLVAPNVQGIHDSDGKALLIDERIEGGPSVLFDAVALIIPPASLDKFKVNPAVRDFVTDAYAHAKFIGYSKETIDLLHHVLPEDLEEDAGFYQLDKKRTNSERFIESCTQLRCWQRMK